MYTTWFKEVFPILASQIFRSFYRHPRTIPSFLPNYLSLPFPLFLGRTNRSNQTYQYFEGQCNHSAPEMARIAVLFFTTLQAWQGQPSTPARATGILCPDWKKVKHKNIPVQSDQKPIYPSDSDRSGADRKDNTSGVSFNFHPYSLSLPEAVKKEEPVCQPLSQDSEKCKELFFAFPHYLLSK